VIASCDKNKYENFGGHWRDGFMYAKINKLGSYVVLLDTIAPKIQALSFPSTLKKGSKVSFKITDSMESKSDDHWPKGKLNFVLEVEDDRGNKSIYRKTVSKQ